MKKYKFPNNFLWGCSTAAHQVEGNNKHCDWWKWEQDSKTKWHSNFACDHYNRYKEDFALAKDFGHNAHRLSLEWSRIEPQKGKISMKAVRHYCGVFKELRKNKLTSFATLWHFTLPQWFLELGGFENRKNIKYFKKYIYLCTKYFGKYVDFWITVNEPTTYTFKSYFAGIWPPGKKNFLTTMKVYKNICVAHNEAYEIIKKNNKNSQISSAHQLINYYSEGGVINNLITSILQYVANDFFYNHTYKKHDFIGLNYYFRNPVSYKYLFKQIKEDDYERIIRDEATNLGWSMNPKGLYYCIRGLTIKFNKPIYILEHGISDPTDKKRIKYIKEGLRWIHRAIMEGSDVRSYLHWSLIDNYEWNLGYISKFGIFSFNSKNYKRIPKESAYFYKKICLNNYIRL